MALELCMELVRPLKKQPLNHVITIGSVQAMRVVVQRQMMVQHSSVVQAVLLARMEDTTIAQGWPSGQPVGPMISVRLESARAMGVVYRRDHAPRSPRQWVKRVTQIMSVPIKHVVVRPRTMEPNSCAVKAVPQARMEDTTIAQGWPSGQPVGPMTSAKANIVREMEVVFKEENVNPLQSRRESLVARTRSVEARPVEGRQQLTMLHLCVVIRWSRGQAMTTAIICPRDLFAGLMISVYLVQAIAKGMDMGSKEASALRAYSVPLAATAA